MSTVMTDAQRPALVEGCALPVGLQHLEQLSTWRPGTYGAMAAPG